MPETKDDHTYPADSNFNSFRVSYQQNLSEMNTVVEFYYTNNTSTKPVNTSKLRHIAGVGSSPVIKYNGLGAYFLDQLEDGIWRLEVMPDAVTIRDPFEKPSLQKEVTRIQWENQPIEILLPDLGQEFSVQGINTDNNASFSTKKSVFNIKPGTYLILKKGMQKKHWSATSRMGNISLGEFVAPMPVNNSAYVVKPDLEEVFADKPFALKTTIVGIDSADKVMLQINQVFGRYEMIAMTRKTAEHFEAEIPSELLTPGLLNYRIIIQKNNHETGTFPGAYPGDPFAWDNYHQESWPLFVAADGGAVELFDAKKDYSKLNIYTPVYIRTGGPELVAGEKTDQLSFKLSTQNLGDKQSTGWQLFVVDKLKGRLSEMSFFTKLVIPAKVNAAIPVQIRVALIDADGSSNASFITLNQQYRDLEIPLSNLKADSSVLLPRPYPGFMPLWFKADQTSRLKLNQLDKIEMMLDAAKEAESLEVESVLLVK